MQGDGLRSQAAGLESQLREIRPVAPALLACFLTCEAGLTTAPPHRVTGCDEAHRGPDGAWEGERLSAIVIPVVMTGLGLHFGTVSASRTFTLCPASWFLLGVIPKGHGRGRRGSCLLKVPLLSAMGSSSPFVWHESRCWAQTDLVSPRAGVRE